MEGNQTNETNTTKTKQIKTPSKNKVSSKMITSSSKEKLKIDKDNSSSNEDLHRNSKYSDDKSKKLNWNNLAINISRPVSATKENEKVQKQSPDKKREKTDTDLFEERIEKKKQRTMMYEKYLQRGGARNPGSKEVPVVSLQLHIIFKTSFERNVL